MNQAHDTLLTIPEIADYFRISQQTVYRWLSRGLLTAIRVGNVTRIRSEDFEEFVEAHVQEADRPHTA
jgi:excisionase family DNA binding protein